MDSVTGEHEAARAAGLPWSSSRTPGCPTRSPAPCACAGQLELHPVRYVRGLAAAIGGDGSVVLEGIRALERRATARRVA